MAKAKKVASSEGLKQTDPQPATRNPQPATRNPQPATHMPQPATRNAHAATVAIPALRVKRPSRFGSIVQRCSNNRHS